MSIEMTPKKRLLNALGGGRVDRTPVIALSNWCVELQQSTGAKFPLSQTDPYEMAKLQSGRYEVWGMDLLISHNDVLSEVTMLGAPIDIGSVDKQPSVLKNPLAGVDPRNYELPKNFLEIGRNPIVDKCAEILVEKYEGLVPVFRLMAGPMLIAGHAWGVDNLCKWINTDPDKYEAAIQICTDLWIETARNSIDSHGVHGTYTTDATASGDLIDRTTFERYLLPEYTRFMKATKDVHSFMHICGNTRPYVDLIPNSGFDGFSFEGPGISVKEVKDAVGKRTALIGNLPTLPIILEGNPELIEKESAKAIADGVDILAPACGTPPLTPNANMIALARSVEPRKFKRKLITMKKVDIEKRHLPLEEEYRALTKSVIEGKILETKKMTEDLISKGRDPKEIIEKSILPGVITISELYDSGFVFIPELLLAADSMMEGVKKCQETLKDQVDSEDKIKILMHVAEGDVHEIGKNIVKAILSAKGYGVIDLGKSVEPKKVVEEAINRNVHIISGTSLMTSTRGAFPRVAELMKEKGLDIPFIIAGCAVDHSFAESMDYAVYCKGPEDSKPVFEGLKSDKKWKEIRDQVHKEYK